jgi:2-octaprenyl-6-methoxyphenol hydroxylase
MVFVFHSNEIGYSLLMYKVDVAVVGAGLNGLVAALALGGRSARRPLNVAVIDKRDPQRFATASYDSRASALTAATQAMFGALGLWDQIKPYAQDMTQIIVTDGKAATERPSLLSFATEGRAKPAAAMVENHHLFAAVLAEIAQSPHIQLLTGQAIQDIHYGPGLAQIILDDGTMVKASLIVGADGRHSITREKAGLKLQGWDYQQSALTLTVGHERPHDGMAEEHFTPTGVFAVLPLQDNRSSLVWTETHDEAQRLLALPDDVFLDELSKRFGSHRGALQLASPRHVHPLSLLIADELVGPRLALIGDAAHVVHPLAGLGLNLGFKDVAALADCVFDALALGEDMGGAAMLERYARWRRFDTVATAYLLDGLNRLFANDIAGLKFIRDAGLKLVDRSAAAKAFFMKEAAGQTGQLPRLMRGLAA